VLVTSVAVRRCVRVILCTVGRIITSLQYLGAFDPCWKALCSGRLNCSSCLFMRCDSPLSLNGVLFKLSSTAMYDCMRFCAAAGQLQVDVTVITNEANTVRPAAEETVRRELHVEDG
jgi:hypothetical protein